MVNAGGGQRILVTGNQFAQRDRARGVNPVRRIVRLARRNGLLGDVEIFGIGRKRGANQTIGGLAQLVFVIAGDQQ